jgi:surface protein
MFYGCQSLKTLDLSGWKTGNVTRMALTFMYCTKLETVEGTENWDTSNVTIMYGMFYDNKSLKSLDVSTWKTGKVTTFASMFSTSSSNAGDIPIEELDVSGWNVSAATDLSYMFYGCGKLKKLDMSGWDVSKVTTTYHMFTDCHSLESLDFSGWNPVSLTNANGMFNDCRSVKVLDVSNFASANLKDCGQMFESCWSLETIIGLEKWNTAKVTNCYEMFTLTKLTELDLSAFDTSSVKNTGRMFNSNAALKTIYVGDGWDMSKVTSSGSMFNGCDSLTGANGTTTAGNPTDVTYARVDQPAVQDAEGNVITEAVPGYLTYKAPVNN